ncbi:DUF1972 domain-containing protein [Ekhidna sp.]
MSKTHIAFVGSRGIPANHGGFETFVEKLALSLENEFQVTVLCERDQKGKFSNLKKISNVSLRYSIFNKSKYPNLYMLDSHLRCLDADIIYSCGVLGSLSMWIPQIFGKTYITNPDGLGWKRDKYSGIKKILLSFLFKVSYTLSNRMVFDSEAIKTVLFESFRKRKNFSVIAYGSEPNQFVSEANQNDQIKEMLKRYNLKDKAYHLVVSRLEPENNVHLILEGYRMVSNPKYPLIIVGRTLDTKYVKELLKYENENIRFIGGLYEENELSIARASCFSYLHGHSVGGTNPSLLEAMNSTNLCICHDNVFNREVTSNDGYYFSTAEELSKIFSKVEDHENLKEVEEKKIKLKSRALESYSWPDITSKYQQLFRSIK